MGFSKACSLIFARKLDCAGKDLADKKLAFSTLRNPALGHKSEGDMKTNRALFIAFAIVVVFGSIIWYLSPHRVVKTGRLGEIGVDSTHYKVEVGHKINPHFSVLSKPGGTIEVNKIICRYSDGTGLLMKDLLAFGPPKAGKCVGSYLVRFHGPNNDIEELNIPIEIEVIKSGSSG